MVPLLTAVLHAQSASSCPQRTVIVNARDKHGNFVPDIQPASLQAKIHGQPVSFGALRREKVPYRIVMLLDGSSSVSGSKSSWEVARLVAGDILAAGGDTRGIAVVIFGSKVEHVMDFTHTASETLAWLRQYQEGATVVPKSDHLTAFLDAIVYAKDMLSDSLSGDVIYAITDGGDNASRHRKEEVEGILLASGIRFFSFYATDVNFPTMEQQEGPPLLYSLARATGGAVLDVPHSTPHTLYDLSPGGRKELAGQLAYIYDLMTMFYQLDLKVPAVLKKDQHWDLRLVDAQGRERKDVELMYPDQLAACAPSSAR